MQRRLRQSQRRALAATLIVAWFALGAAGQVDDLHHAHGRRFSPTRHTHRHRREIEHRALDHTTQPPPALDADADADADLADLLAILAQRQHLHPRPRLLPFMVNPFSPLLLCDHHYGTELEPDPDIVINPLDKGRAHMIKPCEAVCVNAKSFDAFASDILPHIPTKIILFTSRFHIPQVERSPRTDAVKAHSNISHWFAQNPVYPGDDRYTAFPYGIRMDLLEHYAPVFLAHHHHAQATAVAPGKNKSIEHLPFTMTHPSRKPFLTSHVRNVPVMTPTLFYERIARARFLVSPRGDRQDTYRHWEAIGLGARPIANINRTLYGSLFGGDMEYMEDAGDIIRLLDDEDAQAALEKTYHLPSAHRLSSLFWARRVGGARAACLRQVG